MGRKDKEKSSKSTSATSSSAAPPVSQPHKERGARFFLEGNYSRALDCFSESLKSDEGALTTPSSTHLIYSNRSTTYIQLKFYSNALHDAEQCISLAPQWAKAYLRKGEALEHLLQYPEALKCYEIGLTLEPNDQKLKDQYEKIQSLMNELKLNQLELGNQNNNRTNQEFDRYSQLTQWLQAGGARFPKIYLQYYSEDHRGVHALTSLSSEDIILYVPQNYIMTSEIAKASGIAKKMVDCGMELRSKHSYLASYLLQERKKGKDSFWWPYILCLPQKYSNMPIFFDQAKLKLLQGSFTLSKIADRIESLKAEYESICENVPEMKQFTHEEFVWARLVVITRIFGLVINGNKTDGLGKIE
jgi:tetratricopeptide (TPR) repeat protein